MPSLISFAGYAAIALLAFGSVVYACDQQDKREQDLARSRAEMAALEERLADKEREFRKLRRRLGRKNRQVRELAQEVDRLREELASLQCRNVA